MKAAHRSDLVNPADIPIQMASEDIWDKKYRLKAKDGVVIDQTVDETYQRVARALSDVEAPSVQQQWYERFLWALRHGAIPAGRIVSNAGAWDHKPATSTINCTVSGTIRDSMDEILGKVHEAGLTLKAGCGIGYEFSTLRPRGAYVSGAGAYTSGPLSFMDIYDKMCFTVSSAGGRRGAQMGTFDVGHPDVMEFIRAKREHGRLRQFNLSLLITEAFMRAVEADDEWPLSFPLSKREVEEEELDASRSTDVIWREWPAHEGDYVVDEKGLVACRIYRRIKARRLWNMIMTSTYDYAEPGFVLIDRVNEMNNNWFCEDIRATNPCVTADTRLATQYGMVPIGELYETGLPLKVTADRRILETGERGTEVRPAVPAFMTARDADVYRVVTEAGYEIKATEWHGFFTQRGRVDLRDLKPGDELLIQSGKGQFGCEGSAELGVLLGFVAGEGHLTDCGKGQKSVWVDFWNEERSLAVQIAGYANSLIVNASQRARSCQLVPIAVPERMHLFIRSLFLSRALEHYGFTRKSKFVVPEVVWRGTEACVKGYLRALFQANGTVKHDGKNKHCTIQLASSSRALLKDVQMLLANVGVFCRILPPREACVGMLPERGSCAKAYTHQGENELIIEDESCDIFMREIGFLLASKNEKYRGLRSHAGRSAFTSRIAEIVHVGREAVFDTTQPDKHTLIFNGLVTANCGEQPLPPYGSCWTGAMRINTNFGLISTEEAYARSQSGQALQVAVDHVFTGNKTDLRPCTLVCTGRKEVFDVRLANGQHIELTADHRVYTSSGWREVRELAPGAEVYVQARELATLNLVQPFYLGALKYLLSGCGGKTLTVRHQGRRAMLRSLLDLLHVNYSWTAQALTVASGHPVIHEVRGVDLEQASDTVLRGYVYAAEVTGTADHAQRIVYGSEETCLELAGVLEGLAGLKATPTRCGAGNYRLVFPELEIEAPVLGRGDLDVRYAAYGWLLSDRLSQGSEGVALTGGDERTVKSVLPFCQAMTGTNDATCYPDLVSPPDVVDRDSCYRGGAGEKPRGTALWKSHKKHARVPEFIFRSKSAQQASFLAAIFSADADVGVESQAAIQLFSGSRRYLEDIQLLLLNFGVHGEIQSSISKGNIGYRLLLKQRDLYRFYAYIGLPFDMGKEAALKSHLTQEQPWRTRNDDPDTAMVLEVRRLGMQPVYDIEEYSTHTLVVNGVVVHNCLLGSVNLTKFVLDPFTDRATFDWEGYREVVRVFTRMLDNVVEINGLPLEEQRAEIFRKRRHGMGFLGLGSTLTMLGQRYGCSDALTFTERVAREMALTGWHESLKLAEEKGPAPIMDEMFEVTDEMLRKRPEMAQDGFKPGAKLPGRVLWARYSRYMQRIAAEDPTLVDKLAQSGSRFTHHTSIAPTGTISLSLANNASNGIEPSFAHHYFRNVIREGRKSKEKVGVFSFELLAYKHLIDADAATDAQESRHQLPDYFVTADDITPKEHVDIQAAAQKWIDSSISKTANVPTDYPYDEFKDIYRYAWKQGLKGCTTFRFNPEAFQGVLVKEEDLKNTTYRFVLEDGSVVEAKGDEEIEYDGEIHTAANLFDALKEGYYGKW